MSLHYFPACVVIAFAVLSCAAQDKNVPFLQIEHNNSPFFDQTESASATDLVASDKLPGASFEAGMKTYGVGVVQGPMHQRVIDGKFLIANGSSVAMTILDYATSRHCVAVGECSEGNPMMPKSLAGMISIGVLSDAVISGYSYWLKKRRFHAAWAVAPVGNAGLHLWGMQAGLKSW